MKDDEIYRLLKQRFKSNSEIRDKRQSIVESIFGELKVDEDIILSKEYSSSDESDEYKSWGNKNPKPKCSSELQGYQKVHVPGYGNCLYFIIRNDWIWWILWLICSKTINSLSY